MLATSLLITPIGSLKSENKAVIIPPEDVVVTACQVDGKSRDCVVELITKYAKLYDVPQKLALDIASCESGLKIDAKGDGGRAYGIYQFHKQTFKEFSVKYYKTEELADILDYHDTEDNIKLAMWALSNNKGYHWSCYRKIVAAK